MLTRNMTLILPKIYIKSYFTTQMQLKIFWAGTVYRIMPVLNALELVINRISLLRAKSKFLLKKSHSQLVGNLTKNTDPKVHYAINPLLRRASQP